MNAPRFDVDAVMRMWGFTKITGALGGLSVWKRGEEVHMMGSAALHRFATELLMRN